MSQCNLSILAVAPSAALHILDAENQELERKVISFFYALLLAHVFHCKGGLVMSGAMIGGREKPLSVRSVSNLDTHYRPAGAWIETLTAEDLLKARPIAEGIHSIHVPGEEPSRLGRGLHAWSRGMQEFYGVDRLHQFVRAVEALVKPDIGRSTSQFVHRCQLFAGNNAATRELLVELYTLRGHSEHMNPLESGLERYLEAERFEVAVERSFQAQVLASSAYLRIFGNQKLRDSFSKDSLIDGFWKQP